MGDRQEPTPPIGPPNEKESAPEDSVRALMDRGKPKPPPAPPKQLTAHDVALSTLERVEVLIRKSVPYRRAFGADVFQRKDVLGLLIEMKADLRRRQWENDNDGGK